MYICEFYSSFFIWKSSLEWVKCDCLSDDVKAEMSSGYLQPPRRESEELWRLKNIIPTKIFTASLKIISFNNWVLKSWSNNYGCKWKYLFVFNNILIRVESCHLSRCLSIIASMFPRFSVVFKLYSTLEIFILISTCWTPSAVKCMPWDAKSWRVSKYLLFKLHNTWTADLRELGVGNVQRYKMLLELRGMPSWTHGKFLSKKCGLDVDLYSRNMTTCPYI